MIAIASCWPPSVAAGSGTTVSQERLVVALAQAGAQAELLYPSRFASTPAELDERRRRNAELQLDGYAAVLGIDGEGWLWAPKRRVPYLAFCEAVLEEVLPFEPPASARLLRAQARWEASAARASDAVVARSEFAAGRVAEAYGVARSRITVLPIPFDIDAWRRSLPKAPKEALVLAVGHLYARKNCAALLAAWPAVVAARSDARLVVVGVGPEQPALATAAQGLPSVALAGHVAFGELLDLYARATVFCHPSLQENFGIALVEGLASGASVVMHHHPALLENTTGLSAVWAVDARQPEQLANALIDALNTELPTHTRRLDRLRRKLSPVRVGRQLTDLIASLE